MIACRPRSTWVTQVRIGAEGYSWHYWREQVADVIRRVFAAARDPQLNMTASAAFEIADVIIFTIDGPPPAPAIPPVARLLRQLAAAGDN